MSSRVEYNDLNNTFLILGRYLHVYIVLYLCRTCTPGVPIYKCVIVSFDEITTCLLT